MGVGCACPGPPQAVAGMGSGGSLLVGVEMGFEVEILEMEVMRWTGEEGGIGCLKRSEEAEGVRWVHRESLEMGEMAKMEEVGRTGRLL